VEIHILLQQIANGLVLGSTYGLIAVGYTMVYGIIGMINFAHGDIYMVSAYLTAIVLALVGAGLSPILTLGLAFIAVVLLTSLLGFAVEKVAYRPLRRSPRLAPLISAIGMSLVLQNYVQITQGARNQGVPTLIPGGLEIEIGSGVVGITWVQVLIVVISQLAMGSLTWMIHRTALGRACRATEQDAKMAAILGINTDRVISIVFVLGAAMAAVAGVLVTLNYGSFDFSIGFVTGIKAFTAAVLGGIGSLPGAMIGGILLGLSESLFSGFVNTDYKDVFAFSLLILVLLFKPSGLFGRPSVEKV
jgi:branched-chain amino acid transport system permease protein